MTTDSHCHLTTVSPGYDCICPPSTHTSNHVWVTLLHTALARGRAWRNVWATKSVPCLALQTGLPSWPGIPATSRPAARPSMFHTNTFALINNTEISCPCFLEPTVALASCEQVALSRAEWLLLWAHQLQSIQTKTTDIKPYKANMIISS